MWFNYILVSVFVIGYILIMLEQEIKVDKAAISTSMMLILAILVGMKSFVFQNMFLDQYLYEEMFKEAVFHAGGIALFLLASMIIVEVVDQYNGFGIISVWLSQVTGDMFVVMTGIISFLMSSLLDNMTSCIVMSVLIKKIIVSKELRWIILSLILLSVNIGGAWAPTGDVTTTMLWIKGVVSTRGLIIGTILPCIVAEVVAIMGCLFLIKYKRLGVSYSIDVDQLLSSVASKSQYPTKLVFVSGMLALVSGPILHGVFLIPPFIVLVGSLGVLWIITEVLQVMYRSMDNDQLEFPKVKQAIKNIDISSILFFYGIIVSVYLLSYADILSECTRYIVQIFGSSTLKMTFVLGLLSSVIDNVPLVAAMSNMFDVNMYGVDDVLWHGLAYCAGIGGNLMILGSAAGVVIMSIDQISVVWYVKNMGLIALLSYVAGFLCLSLCR